MRREWKWTEFQIENLKPSADLSRLGNITGYYTST